MRQNIFYEYIDIFSFVKYHKNIEKKLYLKVIIMQSEASVLLLDKRMQSLVNDYIPDNDVLNELVGFFGIFSDLTRLRILSALAISEMCVTDLSIMLNLNQTTTSHQLRILRDLGAVKTRRQGKIVFYSLKNEIVNDVLLKGVEYLGY